jgi:hypothetical protein
VPGRGLIGYAITSYALINSGRTMRADQYQIDIDQV